MTSQDLMVDRINRGLSLRAMAVKIGIDKDALRRAEIGGRPSLENAKKIADFYGVQVTDIWPVAGLERVA